MEDVHALVFGRSAAWFLNPPLCFLDMNERLQKTVVVPWKKSGWAASSAHVGVELPWLVDEVKTLELSQVDNHVLSATTLLSFFSRARYALGASLVSPMY